MVETTRCETILKKTRDEETAESGEFLVKVRLGIGTISCGKQGTVLKGDFMMSHDSCGWVNRTA